MTTLRDYLLDIIEATLAQVEENLDDQTYTGITEDQKNDIVNDSIAEISERLVGN